MTEKIARRGRPIPSEYVADALEQVLVGDGNALRTVVSLRVEQLVVDVQVWLRGGSADATHHGYPVQDATGRVVGVVTQRDVFAAASSTRTVQELVRQPLVAIRPSATLREAADTMLRENVGRLPVLEGDRLVGMVTRSDLLEGDRRRLRRENHVERVRQVGLSPFRRGRAAPDDALSRAFVTGHGDGGQPSQERPANRESRAWKTST